MRGPYKTIAERCTILGSVSISLSTPTNAMKRNNETEAWHIVMDVHSQIFGALNRALSHEFGITLAKFDVLAQLYHSPSGLSQGALTQQLKVTGGNVTGLVRRLAQDDLISREMSAVDRRVFIVSLLPKGRALFLEARDRHDALLKEWCAPVTQDEVQSLRKIQQKIAIEI